MLAIVQGRATLGDKAANLARMEEKATAARVLGAELVVFPELFLTGYNVGDLAAELAEDRTGPSLRQAGRIARTTGLTLVFGLPERDGDAVYNTVALIGPDGAARAFYRKVHLFGAAEARLFQRGDRIAVVDVPGLRIGLSICYDIEFAEMARALARAGAQVLLVPTANMTPYWEVPTTLVRARALENGIAVAYANLCGAEGDLTYTGMSAIIGPDGRDIVRAGVEDEALLTAPYEALLPKPSQALSTQLEDFCHSALTRVDRF